MIETLKEILEYLNKVPNRKYGDNYLLALELTKIISNLESQEVSCFVITEKISKEISNEIIAFDTKKKTIKEAISVFKTLRKDAKMAINGKWAVDFSNEESMEGFSCQIELINNILPKLKLLI